MPDRYRRPDRSGELIGVVSQVPEGVQIGLAICVPLLCLHAGFCWFLTDEAYISFRYARNLADGTVRDGAMALRTAENVCWRQGRTDPRALRAVRVPAEAVCVLLNAYGRFRPDVICGRNS